MPLSRHWEGNFEWRDQGDIRPPFNLRMTSILGETITFPQAITPSNGAIFDSGQQFAGPPPGYGGANNALAQCVWPGPPADVYTDAFGSASAFSDGTIAWRDFGGAETYVTGSQCEGGSGSCIRTDYSSAWTVEPMISYSCV